MGREQQRPGIPETPELLSSDGSLLQGSVLPGTVLGALQSSFLIPTNTPAPQVDTVIPPALQMRKLYR